MSNGWAEYTPFDQACHRAGGRRLYNSGRSLKAALRRQRVVELLVTCDFAHVSGRHRPPAGGAPLDRLSRRS